MILCTKSDCFTTIVYFCSTLKKTILIYLTSSECKGFSSFWCTVLPTTLHTIHAVTTSIDRVRFIIARAIRTWRNVIPFLNVVHLSCINVHYTYNLHGLHLPREVSWTRIEFEAEIDNHIYISLMGVMTYLYPRNFSYTTVDVLSWTSDYIL